MRALLLLGFVALALATAAAAAVGDPKRQHNRADMAKARQLLLRKVEAGSR